MKSIQEVAKEFAKDPYHDINNEEEIIEYFTAGANYVLDVIEEFQKQFSSFMNTRADGNLRLTIEKLKSKGYE